MKKIDELITSNTKLAELLGKKTEPEKKSNNVLLWIFAIIGIVASVAAIAYAVYRYMNPEYFDDLDFDDFDDDDFEEDFEEEEDIFVDEEAALNNPASSETAETN